MGRIVFISLFLVVCLSGKTQQFFFSGYTVSDGLSQSVANCIHQDSEGYIWFGTQNGLNRFDGYSFEILTYKPDDSTSISNNWIYGITEDRNGNLWIGTKGGLNKYNREKNLFERIHYTTPYQIDVTEFVYDVKCSRDGNILINTPPVLTICDPETMTFSHFISTLAYDGSVKDTNIPLIEDSEGNTWMGSTRGLACYLSSEGRFQVFTSNSNDTASISNDNVTALFEDKQGNIWIGTSNGLNRFNKNEKRFKRFFHDKNDGYSAISNNFVRAVLSDKAGNLWIATDGGGLNRRISNAAGSMVFENFTTENSGLGNDIIHSLMIDRSENLWIGTLSGIDKIDLKKQKFRLYRNSESPYSIDLADNIIASLYKDDEDAIWIGTWGQGLDIYDRKRGRVDHYSSNLKGRFYIPNDYVHTIFEDSVKLIWIGTRDGLLVYREKMRSFQRPEEFPDNPGLPDFRGLRIFMMMQGRNKEYWIATQDGLFRKRPDRSYVERYHTEANPDQRISGNMVYGVLEDSEGMIWIGTSEGLDVLNPETSVITHFRKEDGKRNSLADDYITTLCEDFKGDIWIGTSSYVNKYSKKDSVFTYYSKENGLTGNVIYSIVEDKSHRLWFATGNGLCRFDPVTVTFRAYTVEEGLQSPEFNLRASFLSKDGELFFGGMKGFNSFYPDSLADNPYIPEIVCTSAYKIKKGIREDLDPGNDNRITLNYNDYSFTLEFAALEFTNPSRNQFRYRLEGINDEWIDIGNRNFIPFSNLPPGEYILTVKGSNNDGLWNEKGTSITIMIYPPWWQSKLAYFFYFILVISLIYLIIKRREKHLIRDRKILEEKVKERTLQIEEQKTEIMKKNAELSELNRSKDKFFSIIAHDLRNPFNSIMGLADIILMDLQGIDQNRLKKYIQNIKGSSMQAYELLENLLLWARSHTGTITFRPEPVNMKSLVEESIKLVRVQAARKTIKINSDMVHSVMASVDKNMIKTVLRNLLTNALKFTSQGGEVRIGLSSENGLCTLFVKDNGIGIAKDKIVTLFNIDTSHKTKGTDQEPGTGLGLILCKEFVEKHGGRIEVESEQGKGSEFRIVLPGLS